LKKKLQDKKKARGKCFGESHDKLERYHHASRKEKKRRDKK